MKRIFLSGVLLVLTAAAVHAQYDGGEDYGGGGYAPPGPSYDYGAPPPPNYGYAPPPPYGYRPPPPRYGYAPPRYGYAPPLHCRIVYGPYGPHRVCPHY